MGGVSTMKQAILTAPGRMAIQDAAIPQSRAGEALVRVLAVGVCGSDLHMFRHGQIGGISLADAGGPFVPGHEGMGRVEDVGAGVDRRLIGRRVFIEPAINCGRCRWQAQRLPQSHVPGVATDGRLPDAIHDAPGPAMRGVA
jgi:L-iditol 2-dehydrogenase